MDPNGLEAKDVGFIVYRDDNSKLSISDKTYRGLDRIGFYNSKTGEIFNLYHAQTYVSHSDYPVGNTLEIFMGGFSIQYLGNVTESGQVLYNKESSKYEGPVFNIQNANTKGLGLTNEQGQIIGDPDTSPIRVYSNYNVNTNQEVNMASGGCLMYVYAQADDFASFLERSGVEPGDTINGYIKEYFEP